MIIFCSSETHFDVSIRASKRDKCLKKWQCKKQLSYPFIDFISELGIIPQFSYSHMLPIEWYSWERISVRGCPCMFIHIKVLNTFGDAVLTVYYLIDHMPSPVLDSQIPYVWFIHLYILFYHLRYLVVYVLCMIIIRIIPNRSKSSRVYFLRDTLKLKKLQMLFSRFKPIFSLCRC